MSDFIILDTKKDDSLQNKKIKFDLASLEEYLLSKQKISIKYKVVFYRLLATMVNAWLSLMKALNILERQEKNAMMKKFYSSMSEWIKKWKSLSELLREYNDNFSDSECSIIESGEKTWKLNHSLLQLADQVEKIQWISKKLKWAFIYPAAIMIIMFVAMWVIMVAVVPKIVEIFWDKDKLPSWTKILMSISDGFVKWWPYMILFAVAFVVGIWIMRKTTTWRYYYDWAMLKMPIFWNVIQKVVLSKFSRVLSNLLSSWISIVESLKILSDIVWNEVYRQRILLLREDVRRWMKIWESLENDALFPDMLVQMIKVWEQTAKLDTIIIKIADFYDEEVDSTISNIQKLLEPIIIVTMAVMVWFIAIWIMQPIMNMADTISNQ